MRSEKNNHTFSRRIAVQSESVMVWAFLRTQELTGRQHTDTSSSAGCLNLLIFIGPTKVPEPGHTEHNKQIH